MGTQKQLDQKKYTWNSVAHQGHYRKQESEGSQHRDTLNTLGY